jgi:hypothetical protein
MVLASRLIRIALCVTFCAVSCVSAVRAGETPPRAPNKSAAVRLIEQMAGTWNVEQRMWPSSGAKAIDLPPAIAHRRVLSGGFLEETMEPAQKSGRGAFTRVSFFNYNAVNQQYEYFSIDSRAPQMMNERSMGPVDQEESHGEDGVALYGGSFVAPRWGETVNAAFRYRLTVGDVENERQVVRLYLTPLSGEGLKEFLAFEYIYTCSH